MGRHPHGLSACSSGQQRTPPDRAAGHASNACGLKAGLEVISANRNQALFTALQGGRPCSLTGRSIRVLHHRMRETASAGAFRRYGETRVARASACPLVPLSYSAIAALGGLEPPTDAGRPRAIPRHSRRRKSAAEVELPGEQVETGNAPHGGASLATKYPAPSPPGTCGPQNGGRSSVYE